MKKKKRPFTLLEIMIVIFLIGLIGSVVGYNMIGSLDKGRAFKTKHTMNQLHDLFELQLAQGYSRDEILKDPAEALKKLGVVKDPENAVKDGWGNPLTITINDQNEISISSARYTKYVEEHGNQ